MRVVAVLKPMSSDGARILLHSLDRVCSGKSGKFSMEHNNSTCVGDVNRLLQTHLHLQMKTINKDIF